MTAPPSSLTRGDISIALLGRSMPGEYHWAICPAYDDTKAYKVHAKQVSSHWFFEDPPVFEDLIKSDIITADVKIGALKSTDQSDFDAVVDLLRQIPMETPEIDQGVEPKFTCRVWLREAVRVLHRNGYIECPDVNALEKECEEVAEPNHPAFPSYHGYSHFVAQSSV
ncbi:hypothetical protein BKA70DRAFT_791071 [Coprinopsis sp. MPI-PUGE-AT-0042]|nr:hypothetical protein BKA70DRAFT_791071 [Coprinopsis sp. MPI-PUGE-AT-0042]